jgi:hypothetical protein
VRKLGRLTPEIEKLILDGVSKTQTWEQISEVTGWGRETCRKWWLLLVQERTGEATKPWHCGNRPSLRLQQRAVKLRAQGLMCLQIDESLGKPPGWAKVVLCRARKQEAALLKKAA